MAKIASFIDHQEERLSKLESLPMSAIYNRPVLREVKDFDSTDISNDEEVLMKAISATQDPALRQTLSNQLAFKQIQSAARTVQTTRK